jgi:hypothetical protein
MNLRNRATPVGLILIFVVVATMLGTVSSASAVGDNRDAMMGAAIVYGVGSAASDDDTDVRDLPTTGRGTSVVEESSATRIPGWQTVQSVLILGFVAVLAFAGLALHDRHQRR